MSHVVTAGVFIAPPSVLDNSTRQAVLRPFRHSKSTEVVPANISACQRERILRLFVSDAVGSTDRESADQPELPSRARFYSVGFRRRADLKPRANGKLAFLCVGSSRTRVALSEQQSPLPQMELASAATRKSLHLVLHRSRINLI
jgi:hypothetical protein